MKKIVISMMVIALVFSCKETPKQNEVELEIEEVEKGVIVEWETLFDGTNFDSWRGYNTNEMYSEWTIEDDAMAFTPSEEGGKNIITKNKYTDFILSLEWKISKKGNSGIFWSVFEDDKFREAYQTGPEIQVLDNAEHPDSFVAEGTHKAGSLYDMIKCPPELVNAAGEWNKMELEINHKTNLGKVTMNGTEAMTFPLAGPEWDAMIANSKFKDWEGFGKYHEGHIGLQDHSDKVWYRNIKIKQL